MERKVPNVVRSFEVCARSLLRELESRLNELRSQDFRQIVNSRVKALQSQDFRKIVHSRNFIPTVLIVIGALLVLYVGSQYAEMYFQQKRLAEAWEQEQAIRGDASSDQAHAQKDDGLVRLVIPKIDLTSFVVEGTNHKSLLLGPGHMTKTAEPGQPGNSVITGHRDTFFRHIYELEKGDQLYIERGGKRFVYKVTGKKIVEPTDISVTRPTNDAQVTLITCYPIYFIGPAPKRLVVFSKLESEQDAALTASTDEDRANPASMSPAAVTAPR